ncbi:MAG TPA: 4Fe-4S binding protein, partial [Candidatus Limnocylindrales bacterium]|nr:4Fe-4S binding protein [Candidatus Limnocylindrales bacterium]
AAILRGPGVFGKIAGEMAAWLSRHGHAGPGAVTGFALGRPATRTSGVPLVEPERCNGCGLCELSCAHDAIEVLDGKAIVHDELCSRCGLCLSRCRPGALLWSTPAG